MTHANPCGTRLRSQLQSILQRDASTARCMHYFHDVYNPVHNNEPPKSSRAAHHISPRHEASGEQMSPRTSELNRGIDQRTYQALRDKPNKPHT